MLRKQTWQPDTCASETDTCAIEMEWDDEAAPSARTHTPTTAVRTCSAHVGFIGTQSLYDKCLLDNRRREIARNILRNTLAIDESLITVTFGAPPERVVTVDTGGQLSGRQVRDIQSLVDTQFGPGIVTIT